MDLNQNEKLGKLAEVIDQHIWKSYKLWPSNFIAYDLLHKETRFSSNYSEQEKNAFEKRLKEKIDVTNPLIVENFLAMYANPVVNRMRDVS
jgi:hypothetical protein